MGKKAQEVSILPIIIAALIVVIAIVLIFVINKSNTSNSNTSKNIQNLDVINIRIGVVTTTQNKIESYQKLKDYLKKNLVGIDGKTIIFNNQVLNISDNVEEIPITKEGAFDEIEDKIKNKKWDIAFLVEPLLANEAISKEYRFVAPMFPDYQLRSALITNKDGCIKSFNDLYKDISETKYENKCLNDRQLKVGYKSLGLFYMPIFDLINAKFSKRETLKEVNSVDKILEDIEKDSIGNSVGAVIYLPQVIASEKKNKIRVLGLSRLLPNGSILISPKIPAKLQNKLAAILLDAPQELKDLTRYGEGNMPDYQLARGIKKRAEELLTCSQKEQNQKIFTLNDCLITSYDSGEINGIKMLNESLFEFVFKKESNEIVARISFSVLAQEIGNNITKEEVIQTFLGSRKYSKISLTDLTSENFVTNSNGCVNGYIEIKNAGQVKFE